MLEGAVITRQQKHILAVLMCVFALFLSVGIQDGSHFDSDDTLYSEMARQMVQSGNWADNHWGDSVQFEKPPLYIWSLAVSGTVLGWSEGAMRLPGTLFALAALAALYLLMLGLGASTRQAVFATLLFSSSYLFLLMARRLMMDLPMVACCLAAAASVTYARPILFGVFSGLAVMCKGAASGPLLVAIFVFAAWTRVLSVRQLIVAVCAGLAVAAPWHIVESLRYGSDFWNVYLFHHVGERATSHVVPGLSLAQLFEVSLNEVVLGLLALIAVVPFIRSANKAARILVALWFVFALLPVLFSTTRLPHYLLPTFVPLVILSAFALVQAEHKRIRVWVLAGVVIVVQMVVPAEKFWVWFEPDFGRSQKAIALTLHEVADSDDYTATFNTTTNALTFYANRRFDMLTNDARFYDIQDTVVLIRRAGVLKRVEDGGISVTTPYSKRFIVARKSVDRSSIVASMRKAHPNRDLHVLEVNHLELVNDAGVGDPIP